MRGVDQKPLIAIEGTSMPDGLWTLEKGFSSALVVIAATALSVAILASGLGFQITQERQKSQYLTDSAALAATDSLRGLIAGFPCENAGQILQTGGLRLKTCRIVGFGVTIQAELSRFFGTLSVEAMAAAPMAQ